MIACVLPPPDMPVNRRRPKLASYCRAQEEVIEPQARVSSPGIPKVVPEGVDHLIWMLMTDGIGPALCGQFSKRRADFRPEQRVVFPTLRLVHVEIGRHHVVVAGKDDGNIQLDQLGRIGRQSREPTTLVFELGTWRGIAVRQIEASKQDAIDGCFNVAALAIARIAWEALPCLHRLLTSRKDRYPVPGFLPMPNRTVAGLFDLSARKSVIGCLQFLQAHDIGLGFLQPLKQNGQTAVYTVDVVCRYLQISTPCSSSQPLHHYHLNDPAFGAWHEVLGAGDGGNSRAN